MSSDCPCCGDPRPPVTFGLLKVDLDQEAVWWGEERIPFSPHHRAILHHLARRGGFARNDAIIMAAMGEESSLISLRCAIFYIRQRLLDRGIPLRIETVHATGYRLAWG